VSSDQLLSGLPFHLKFSTLPESDAQLFPDLDPAQFDAQDLAVLHAFELQLAPPYLFAVSADAELGRLVHGSSISGHRTYWALLRLGEEALQGARTVCDVGPLRCFELDPGSSDGARALAQLGYDVRFGVSVRFAGSPSINRDDSVPTFVAGDNRVVVPERLAGEAALVIDLDGLSVEARSAEVIRVMVETGDHRVLVSSETDSREYPFRGIAAPLPRSAPIYLDLLAQERTVQALLGGRLNFMVDGAAPIDGLELTVDLELGSGRVFSATGPLGAIPQRVSTEHPVMTALLSEDVQDHVSGATRAMLRVQIGQTRTQRTVTTSTTAAGNSNQRVQTLTRAYQQSSGGLLTQYGNTATFTQVDGGVSRPSGSSKVVITPPYVDKFYRLALGESTTVSVTAVVTANPPPPQFSTTTTNTFTETTTYVGNETVTVFGRSFNTCKYVRNTVPANGAPSTISTGWRMLGKGVVVKLESTSAGVTTLLQFKSGTLNGVPL